MLKLTSPGVPDFYQGDELELLAMVDPDNRRPVDWDLRQTRLAHLIGGGRPGESDHKLWITLAAARVAGTPRRSVHAATTSRSTPARTPARSFAAARS